MSRGNDANGPEDSNCVDEDFPALGSCLGDNECVGSYRLLFRQLVDAGRSQKENLYRKLLELGDPRQILAVALDEYRKRGYDYRLTLASALLGDLGQRSWNDLRSLARSGQSECEYFVATIANLAGVSANERLRALADLASNPHKDVRRMVLEALTDFEPEQTRPDREALWQGKP